MKRNASRLLWLVGLFAVVFCLPTVARAEGYVFLVQIDRNDASEEPIIILMGSPDSEPIIMGTPDTDPIIMGTPDTDPIAMGTPDGDPIVMKPASVTAPAPTPGRQSQ